MAEGQSNFSPPSVDYGDGAEDDPSIAEGPSVAAPASAELGGDEGSVKESEKEVPHAPMRPKRVEVALKNSKTFEQYRKNRPFKFLHMYSGPRDPLGEAIKVEAARNRLETVILSLDKERDPSLDLADPEGFGIMKEDVSKGEWDYTHAGFPCGSFSMARHHKVA